MHASAKPSGSSSGSGVHVAEILGDFAERAQASELVRLHRRRVGQALLHGRENLDALDRVNAQISVELHVEFEDVLRVSGLLRDDFEEHGSNVLVAGISVCAVR